MSVDHLLTRSGRYLYKYARYTFTSKNDLFSTTLLFDSSISVDLGDAYGYDEVAIGCGELVSLLTV